MPKGRLRKARAILGLQNAPVWWPWPHPKRERLNGERVLSAAIFSRQEWYQMYGNLVVTRCEITFRPWRWLLWWNPFFWFFRPKSLSLRVEQIGTVRFRSSARNWGGSFLQPALVIRTAGGDEYTFHGLGARPTLRVLERVLQSSQIAR